MDGQTRHELKKNALQAMLADFGFLKSETARSVLLVVVGAAVLLGGYRLWQWNSVRVADDAWRELMDATVPGGVDGSAALDVLRQIASSASDDNIRAWADLRLGCGLLRQAEFDPTKREQYVAESVEVLERVSGASTTPAPVAAASKFALANAYEAQKEFDRAKTTYQEIVDEERFVGSPFKTLAGERIETADDLRATVTFTPGDPPPAKPLVPTTKPLVPTTKPLDAGDASTSQPASSTGPAGARSDADPPPASQPADGDKQQP